MKRAAHLRDPLNVIPRTTLVVAIGNLALQKRKLRLRQALTRPQRHSGKRSQLAPSRSLFPGTPILPQSLLL